MLFLWFAVITLVHVQALFKELVSGLQLSTEDGNNLTVTKLTIPEQEPKKEGDAYCTGFRTDGKGEFYITDFKLELSDKENVRQVELFGCADSLSKNDAVWECTVSHAGICSDPHLATVMFAWENTTLFSEQSKMLPPSTGFLIRGNRSSISFLVLRVQYAWPSRLHQSNAASLHLTLTQKPPKYLAATHVLGMSRRFTSSSGPVHMCCKVTSPLSSHIFAYYLPQGRGVSVYKTVNQTSLRQLFIDFPDSSRALRKAIKSSALKDGDFLSITCGPGEESNRTNVIVNDECVMFVIYFTDNWPGGPPMAKSSVYCATGNCTNRVFPTGTNKSSPSVPHQLTLARTQHANQAGITKISNKTADNLDYNRLAEYGVRGTSDRIGFDIFSLPVSLILLIIPILSTLVIAVDVLINKSRVKRSAATLDMRSRLLKGHERNLFRQESHLKLISID